MIIEKDDVSICKRNTMVCHSNNSHKQQKILVASNQHRPSKWPYKTPLDVFAKYKRCQTQGEVNPMSLDIQTEYKEDIIKHYSSMNADYEMIPSEYDDDTSPSDAHEPSDSKGSDVKKVDVQTDVIRNPIPKAMSGCSRLTVVDIGTILDVSKDIPDYCALIAHILQCQQVYVVKYDDSKEVKTVHLLCDTDDVGKTSFARLRARQTSNFQLMWEDDARDNGYIE